MYSLYLILTQRHKSRSPDKDDEDDNYVPYVSLKERRKAEVHMLSF